MVRYLIALNCLIVSAEALGRARTCTFTNNSDRDVIIETYDPRGRWIFPKTVRFTISARSGVSKEVYLDYPINSFYPTRLLCFNLALYGSALKGKQIPPSGKITILEKGEFMVDGQIIKSESR